MTKHQEIQLLRRVLDRLDGGARAQGPWRGGLVLMTLVAVLISGSFWLFGKPSSASLAFASCAFLAGLVSMLYFVKTASALQWRAIAPHVDRASVEARLVGLEA